jgi:hypothetical protein
MTASQLIEALQSLPGDTFICIFDPETSDRFMIDANDTLDQWTDGFADLNLTARTDHIQAD